MDPKAGIIFTTAAQTASWTNEEMHYMMAIDKHYDNTTYLPFMLMAARYDNEIKTGETSFKEWSLRLRNGIIDATKRFLNTHGEPAQELIEHRNWERNLMKYIWTIDHFNFQIADETLKITDWDIDANKQYLEIYNMLQYSRPNTIQ
jgi:hypothetical protein